MQPQPLPQPLLPYGQPGVARNFARQGCMGCLQQLRGCLILVVALAVLGAASVWTLSAFSHVPVVVFFNPLPYFTQYQFVVHPGQTEVYAVAWSPDGKRIASGSSEEDTLQVWDAATGRTLFSYKAPHGKLMPFAWSPDGRRLALADLAHPLVVLDAATGKTLFAVTGTGGNLSIAWSPDGRQIAAVSPPSAVQVWDTSSGRVVASLQGTGADEVAWSPNGRDLAATDSGNVHVWDVASGQTLLTNTRKSLLDGSSKLAWSPDSRLIAAQVYGPDQVREQAWDVASGRSIFTYAVRQNSESEFVAAWSPDSRLLAISGGNNRSIGVWDIATGKKLVTYGGHEIAGSPVAGAQVRAGIAAIAWSPNGKRIVSLGIEDTVQIWDPATAMPLFIYDTRTGNDVLAVHGRWATDGARAVAWSPDGTRVAVGGDKFAEVWRP